MVGPKEKREAVELLKEKFKVSLKRACDVLGLNRSTFDYKRTASKDEAVKTRMLELTDRFRRFGRPRIHALLFREGLVQNEKRTRRIYCELKLQLKHRRGKKKNNVTRIPLPKASRPNQIWSMDFIHDRLECGRKLKILNVVDDYTKICIGQFVGSTITGFHLVKFFSDQDELPTWLRCDNGPEFWSNVFQNWGHGKVNFDFIQPGKPQQNAYIESFNGKFRDECLNQNIFFSIEHAKELIENWRNEYNEIRPHSSIGMKSPKEFEEEYFYMIKENSERVKFMTS